MNGGVGYASSSRHSRQQLAGIHLEFSAGGGKPGSPLKTAGMTDGDFYLKVGTSLHYLT